MWILPGEWHGMLTRYCDGRDYHRDFGHIIDKKEMKKSLIVVLSVPAIVDQSGMIDCYSEHPCPHNLVQGKPTLLLETFLQT